MRRLLTATAVALVAMAAMLVASCGTVRPKSDAVMGATTKYAYGKSAQPPKKGAYEVIGVMDVLKKCIIKYNDMPYRGGEPFADSATQSLISITPTKHQRDLYRTNGFTLFEFRF